MVHKGGYAKFVARARDQGHSWQTMPNLQQEREHLARADRHIAEGARRVAEQIDLIAWMTKKGHDLTEAQKLLRNYEETLAQWRWHRRLIMEEITRLEGSPARGRRLLLT